MPKSKKIKKSQKSTAKKPSNAIQNFMRLIYRGKSIRGGLSNARLVTSPENYPNIIEAVRKDRILRHSLSVTNFPETIPDYKDQKRLGTVSVEGELIWTASILSFFSTELSNYYELKTQFQSFFVSGKLIEAGEILDEIESELGNSFWLISKRIQLLQLQGGLKTQKDYLEKVISTRELSQPIAFLAYWISLRSEENVSFATLESDLSDLLSSGEIADFIRYALLPYNLTKLHLLEIPLSWCEPYAVIDRYEVFVSVLQVYLAKKKSITSKTLIEIIERLSIIGDQRIKRLSYIIGIYELPSNEMDTTLYDKYTTGQYLDVINHKKVNLELIARSWALLNACPIRPRNSSLLDDIVYEMFQIITLTSEAASSRQRLKKISLFLFDQEFSYQILGFLERSHDHIFIDQYTEVDRLVSLNTELSDPWNISIITNSYGKASIAVQFANHNPKSPALTLRKTLNTKFNINPSELTNLDIPDYRKNLYLAHSELLKNNTEKAIELYRKAENTKISYVSETARRYLFNAFFSSNMLKQAVDLAVSEIIKKTSTADSYPLSELCDSCLRDEQLLSDISLAVLLFIATREGYSRFDRDISDIYENIMNSFELKNPSQLPLIYKDSDKSILIFFLRNVCTPRVLDDTTYFNSVEEIEAERIAVCQSLLSIDSNNSKSYLDEIRSLTRAGNVAKLLSKIQISKIFVDEPGIRMAIEPTLRDYLKRYQELLRSPNLAYQAEKLSKRIGEMLNDRGHPEFKNVKLPASERDSLFSAMLLDVASEFAFNPAYGLDTHVSTSIRHGAFEGHLRGPFALEDLLCVNKGEDWMLPRRWEACFSAVSQVKITHIRKCLIRFTQRFDEVIRLYLNRKLHIKVTENDDGLFSFDASEEQLTDIMSSISEDTQYDELMDIFIAHCWKLTIQSLENIRLDIRDFASKSINNALDNLIKNIESKVPHEEAAPLIDATARARTSFVSAIDDVTQWFQKPTDLSRDPFELETAVHVALQQIRNCYVINYLEPKLLLGPGGFKFDGIYLDGLCEILFILLQNCLIHSGYSDAAPSIKIVSRFEETSLFIECSNSLSSDIDISERKESASQAMLNYEGDSALKMARKEGGSGLSKIWRICEHNFKIKHSIELSVDEEWSFTTKLNLHFLDKK
jgi:hypothetical protein